MSSLGHAHDAPGHIGRIATAVEHACQPVERSIRIRATHRFVQRRDLLVEHIALAVEATVTAGQCSRQNLGRQGCCRALSGLRNSEICGELEQIERAACITVGTLRELQEFGITGAESARTESAFRILERVAQDDQQLGIGQRFQHAHPCPRQQRIVEREGRDSRWWHR
jgi:hypothetical protein